MSRGHGRLKRIVLQHIRITKYGCTIPQLVYATHGYDPANAPSEAQVAAVRRVVGRLLEEEHVVERVMFGTDRYLLPAVSPVPRDRRRRMGKANRETLECVECDLRWVSEDYAPHRLCWSCGEPGQPARSVTRRRPA